MQHAHIASCLQDLVDLMPYLSCLPIISYGEHSFVTFGVQGLPPSLIFIRHPEFAGFTRGTGLTTTSCFQGKGTSALLGPMSRLIFFD